MTFDAPSGLTALHERIDNTPRVCDECGAANPVVAVRYKTDDENEATELCLECVMERWLRVTLVTPSEYLILDLG